MRVLVVGGGGREHALCAKIADSPICDTLFCAPGNPGIADVATCVNVAVEDIDGLCALVSRERIDFVMVGPEVPLVLGLVDKLRAQGTRVFGPTQSAARLEGSKAFMKDLFKKYGVPTAWYGRFTDAAKAKAFISEKGAPIVVKADGLAAGKGVTVARSVAEAHAAVDSMMTEKVFGDAGCEVVVEEFLEGEEVSFFALVDGKTALPLIAAQDHKTVGDGDTGPNTGGMGAYSPVPAFNLALQERVMREIIAPTVAGLAAEGAPFTGVLFAGLMLTKDGPKTLEFNVRFGDPECQVLMTRMKSDLLPALVAAADGVLDHFDLRWHDEAALVVVMATNGYPGTPQKGTVIEGLGAAAVVPGVHVFHAGTKAERRDGKDVIVANGGRVLGIVGTGASVAEAQANAYKGVDAVKWPGGFCRRDIGWRAISRGSK